jgi:hypothetical protein
VIRSGTRLEMIHFAILKSVQCRNLLAAATEMVGVSN